MLTRYKVIEEEASMPSSKPRALRPYEESAYDFCDVIDKLADRSGEHIAQKEVSRAIAQLAARYPQATDIALGATRRTVYQVAYKAAAQFEKTTKKTATKAAAPADVIDMALARYREAAVAVAQQAGDQAVAADIEQQREDLLRKYGQSADGAGAGTATSSGDGSKQKAYDPARDPYAIAAHADQLREGHRLKYAVGGYDPGATDDADADGALADLARAVKAERSAARSVPGHTMVATTWQIKKLAAHVFSVVAQLTKG